MRVYVCVLSADEVTLGQSQPSTLCPPPRAQEV